MNKSTLLIGGAGVLGVVVIYSLLKNRGASPLIAPPAQVGSMQVPSYPPPADIKGAPINIATTPYYQTYNFPLTRNTIPKNVFSGKKVCGCVCDEGIGVGAVVSPAIAAQIYGSQSRAWSIANVPSNQTAQFPPNQFPWLYQGGR